MNRRTPPRPAAEVDVRGPIGPRRPFVRSAGIGDRAVIAVLSAVAVAAVGVSIWLAVTRTGQHAERRRQSMRYRCRECGHEFSVTVAEINRMMRSGKASAEGLDCPDCEKNSAAVPIYPCPACEAYFAESEVRDNRCPHCQADLAEASRKRRQR